MSFFQRLFGKPKETPPPGPDPAEIDKQIKRLSKELYKWNTLVEAQSAQTHQSVESVQEAIRALERERANATAKDRLNLIKALFPVLDNIAAGITSGSAQIETIRVASPDAAQMLAAWLDGQRLLLERLNAILEAEGVRPIATIGQPFNPYRHVAVKTDYDPTKASGTILSEERRGYSFGDEVLRYADVVVNKVREVQTETYTDIL